MNDEIHAARHVRKMHTTSPSAYSSPGLGPVGWVSEGSVRVPFRPVLHARLDLEKVTGEATVGLLTVGLGDDGHLVAAAEVAGCQGESSSSRRWAPDTCHPPLRTPSRRWPRGCPWCSRAGGAPVRCCERPRAFVGSEQDLQRRGIVLAGALDGLKSRLLLTLLLRSGRDGQEILVEAGRWFR
jgi:L-asparaginase